MIIPAQKILIDNLPEIAFSSLCFGYLQERDKRDTFPYYTYLEIYILYYVKDMCNN